MILETKTYTRTHWRVGKMFDVGCLWKVGKLLDLNTKRGKSCLWWKVEKLLVRSGKIV